jgi:signal transduction histidine kinase
METLDLARIHGEALLALMPADGSDSARDRTVKQASVFFLDVLTPLERTRGATLRNLAELGKSNDSLRQRTGELTTANRSLKSEILQRKSAEHSLRQSEKRQARLLQEARQMQIRLRHLSHQVLSAQEEERKEISRELHDEIVQTLTGINVQLASLKIESGASKESFTKHISYTQRLVEKSVNIVHRFARDLRPTLLDDLGLIPALLGFFKAFTARSGLRVQFVAFSGVEELSNDKRTVLFRVAQAALVNVAQHARAISIKVTIKHIPNAVLMEIKDDGVSFDVKHALDSRRNKRLGLIGMRERVEMVGGKFRVESRPGFGTMISARLPFNARPGDKKS